MSRSRVAGIVLLGIVVTCALAAPLVAPHAVSDQFTDFPYAPPMRIRIIDANSGWRAPFVYPLRLVDRLERRYEEDVTSPISLQWFADGKFVRLPRTVDAPLLLLGSDSLGRDILSRLLFGARTSLGVAAIAAAGALLLGAILGGLSGYVGGWVDETLMRVADFVLVLPAVYVVLVLRAVLPLVLPAWQIFALLAVLLALVGWPYAARGVRAIVAVEARREYAEAARSIGAGHLRILFRHLLPAASGFLLTQALLLLPAFILAEATLSFVGLGFTEPTPSWGAMLQLEGANVRAIAEFPWVLAPAGAIVCVVLALHLAGGAHAGTEALAPAARAANS